LALIAAAVRAAAESSAGLYSRFMSDADGSFAALARSAVDGMLERRPELATALGDHSHDAWLTIGTPGYHDEVARWCADRLADAAAIDLDRLSPEFRVDAQILANELERVRLP
jgi:uncharacterized protein (DUF885 family)